MAGENDRYTFDRVVRMVLSAAAVVIVLLLLKYLSDVLLPFVAAVILAYLLNPTVTWLERKTKRRGLAIGLTLGGLGIIGVLACLILVPLVIAQAGRLRDDIEDLRRDLSASVTAVPIATAKPVVDEPKSDSGTDQATEEDKSTLGWRELMNGLDEYRAQAEDVPRAERLSKLGERIQGTLVGQGFERARQFLQSDEFNQVLLGFAKKLAIGSWTVVTFALNLVLGLTGLIIVLLYLVFLLMDYREYAKTWHTFLPPAYRDTIIEFLEQFDTALRRYFRGQSVVALLTGTLFAVGFTIIGLPMAVPFGLFVGLLNMVPYLQTVALVPGVLLAALRALEADSSFLMSVVLVLVIFGVVQLIQDGIIVPRIMGHATGLRPVAILLGVFIWGKLLGFLGLLLAIPLTCLGIAYYRRYILLHSVESTKIRADDS